MASGDVINLNSRRKPTCFTVHVTVGADGDLEFSVEGLSMFSRKDMDIMATSMLDIAEATAAISDAAAICNDNTPHSPPVPIH